jgi:hypothetical protein
VKFFYLCLVFMGTVPTWSASAQTTDYMAMAKLACAKSTDVNCEQVYAGTLKTMYFQMMKSYAANPLGLPDPTFQNNVPSFSDAYIQDTNGVQGYGFSSVPVECTVSISENTVTYNGQTYKKDVSGSVVNNMQKAGRTPAMNFSSGYNPQSDSAGKAQAASCGLDNGVPCGY